MAFLGKANQLLIRRPSAFVYKYAKQLSLDYRDALVDTGKKMVQRPLKTLFYSSTTALLVYAYRTMPSLDSYKSELVRFRHHQLLMSSLIRNKQVDTYVNTIEQLLLRDQIHFVDCYLFSLIVYRAQHRTSDFSHRFFENVCSYLHLKRNARIIDVGVCNRWFQLHRQLRQADLFDEETNEKIAV